MKRLRNLLTGWGIFLLTLASASAVENLRISADSTNAVLEWQCAASQSCFVFFRPHVLTNWYLLHPAWLTGTNGLGSFTHTNALAGGGGGFSNAAAYNPYLASYSLPTPPWDTNTQSEIVSNYPGLLPTPPWSSNDQQTIVYFDALARTNSTNAANTTNWLTASTNLVAGTSGYYWVVGYLEDADSDGLYDAWEFYLGTDPFNRDTDGDGVSDGAEVVAGTNPLDFYNGAKPCMDSVLVGGYLGVVSNRLLIPIVARINGANGILTNAPVTFALSNGAAWLTPQLGHTWATNALVRADADGYATAWLSLPENFTNQSYFTLTAGFGTNVTKAFVRLGLQDFSGTGQFFTNTNALPMPLALAVNLKLLNPAALGGCGTNFAPLVYFQDHYFTSSVTPTVLVPKEFTNDLISLTLHNTVSNAPYQLYWKLAMTDTNWTPGEIIQGNGGSVDYTPFPVSNNAKMFFGVFPMVSLRYVSNNIVNAREANTTLPDPGLATMLVATRTGPTNAALSVGFALTGSASYGADYELTYTNGLPFTNAFVIPAGASIVTILVNAKHDNVPEFDESAVVVLTNQWGYLVNPTNRYVQVTIDDNPRVSYFETVTELPTPVGIDYSPATNALIISVNYATGDPHNFIRLSTNSSGLLITNEWSAVRDLTSEVKLATVKTTANGYTNGEMFFGTGTPGVVGKLSADGLASNLSWAILSGATLLRGSFYMDETGVFSNNLIVVTGDAESEGGEVWLIATTNGSATNAVLLASLTDNPKPQLEGVITLPDDPSRFGPWAAKIITGAESALDENFNVKPRIYTIAANGIVTTNYMGIAPEDFDLIPPHQDLYCALEDASRLDKLPRALLTNHWGDLLITQSGDSVGDPPKTLFIVHWDSTNLLFYTTAVLHTDYLEHVTFAPVDLPSTPQ